MLSVLTLINIEGELAIGSGVSTVFLSLVRLSIMAYVLFNTPKVHVVSCRPFEHITKVTLFIYCQVLTFALFSFSLILISLTAIQPKSFLRVGWHWQKTRLIFASASFGLSSSRITHVSCCISLRKRPDGLRHWIASKTTWLNRIVWCWGKAT